MKKEKEFNLSEKRKELLKYLIEQFGGNSLIPQDIMKFVKDGDKEFIKRIEMTMLVTPSPTERGKFILWLSKEIRKLAGEKLI